MEAQLITVYKNGYAEARDPSLLNRFDVIDIIDKSNIKSLIWNQLRRLGRKGHVLVRWSGKLFVCEMKNDMKGYTRVEVEYHPHMDKFKI